MDTPGLTGEEFTLLMKKEWVCDDKILNGRKLRIKFTPDQTELLMIGDAFFGEKGYKFWKLNNVWYKSSNAGDFTWEAVNEIDLIQYALNNWSKVNG